jgi:hypothetical protein
MKNKIIKIKFDSTTIKVSIGRSSSGARTGTGSIETNLHQPTSLLQKNDEYLEYNSAIDGLEALILGHACAGIDIENQAYVLGIESAIEAISNNT